MADVTLSEIDVQDIVNILALVATEVDPSYDKETLTPLVARADFWARRLAKQAGVPISL